MSSAAISAPVQREGRSIRPAVWVIHMAIPVLGLWLLVARPQFDALWEHHDAHFWLVVSVALVNVVIGARMNQQTRQRADARLFLVSLAFLSSAGFLALHALATPDVLVSKNTGFVIATPVGLFLASIFAALSCLEFSPVQAQALMRWRPVLLGGLALVVVGWAAATLLEFGPLSEPIGPTEAAGRLRALAIAGTVLYGTASVRYYLVHRRRPSVMLLSVITAFFLLAEAMVAVAYARNWHASWWEWHLLMAGAFGFVAYSARVQYQREGSPTGLFNGISLEQTIRTIRDEHGQALEELVSAMRRQLETGSDEPLGAIASRLGDRFGLTERQVELLQRAAEALAGEREQIQHLGALVEVGQQASVITEESQLLERALELTGEAFTRDDVGIGLLHQGELRFMGEARAGGELAAMVMRTLEPEEATSSAEGATLVLPLTVKGHAAGVLAVGRRSGAFADRDRFLLRSLASQLSTAVENARLYRQIDGLFRQYMSPDVATALLADPDQASLGGAITEVTVLFADLRGFTPFSERTSPDQVVSLLNRYFGIAVPLILAEGGTVVQFVGDAVMALFNAPTRQPDHALRACRAALAMQRAIDEVAVDQPDWPRFRVGINTGPALVGNIGSAEFRNFTAIGDTTNLAARLEGSAQVGQVVIGSTTCAQVRDLAVVEPLAPFHVKGKEAPVDAYVLVSLR